jgi:hypothetical protein
MIKNDWERLVEAALLGIERTNWTAEQCPEWVQHKLTGTATDEAAQLLHAATLMRVYQQAGERSPAQDSPVISIISPETQPYCTPVAVQLWRQIRALENKIPVLETRWLELCRQSGSIADPAVLMDILEAGVPKKMATLRPYIAPIVGNRGRWLAQYHAPWQYVLPVDPAKIWKEGKIADRTTALRLLRRQDAIKGREWLAATWEKESNSDRKALILAFGEKLVTEDEPFLMEVLQELNPQKAANKELRIAVLQQLLQLPESAVYQQWKSIPQCYLSPAKHLANWPVPLPEIDAALEKKAWDILIPLTPPQLWCEVMGQTVTDTVTALSSSHQLTDYLAQATVRYRHADFAERLCHSVTGPRLYELLEIVLAPMRENIIRSTPELAASLNWGASALQFQWSEAFSNWALQQLYHSWGGYYFHKIQQIMPLDVFLHPNTRPEAIPAPQDPTAKRERWMQMIVPELDKTLSVKKLLKW